MRFLIESILVILYGPAVLGLGLQAIRHHLGLVLGGVGLVIMGLALYVLRRVFDRRKGIVLPVEEVMEMETKDTERG